MNAIEMILAKENPLEGARLAGDEIHEEWEEALAAINKEFESKSDQFLREERVQAAKVAELSRLMLG